MNKQAEKLLAPFGWIFGGISTARRGLYRRGFFKSVDLGVPVVSVGNLTVGGTGKTPLVALVAKLLAASGHRVCVLTRGYKREHPRERVVVSDERQILADVRSAGDEPFELSNQLLGTAAVIADRNRAAAGVWALENLGITAFVLDDGFQHLRLKRDLDIVCIDATNPFGNKRLLPAGILREPLASLRRADCIVLTRSDLVPDSKFQISQLKSKILKFTDCPILPAQTRIVGLTEIKEFPAKPQNVQIDKTKNKEQRRKNAFAFCALGNPHGFFESLRRADYCLSATKEFADHYVYQQTDVDLIEKEAQSNKAEILLTTAKDAVKLKSFKFSLPCFVIEIETVFDDDEPLRELLQMTRLKFEFGADLAW